MPNTKSVESLSDITVSVVIPFFNHSAHLAEALASVQGQSLSVLECIIVNDGSSTAEIKVLNDVIRAFSGTLKIICLHQENQGPGMARYRGANSARGDYIAFLDADDYWFPAKLACQLPQMIKMQLDCSILETHVEDRTRGNNYTQENSRYLTEDTEFSIRNLLAGKIINFSSTLMIRNRPGIVSNLELTLRRREDHFFLMIMIARFKTRCLPEVHNKRMIHKHPSPQDKIFGLAQFRYFLQDAKLRNYITNLQKRLLLARAYRYTGRSMLATSWLNGIGLLGKAVLLWPPVLLGSKCQDVIFGLLAFPDGYDRGCVTSTLPLFL
jgi:glycosyltransferase involved in cell wall biosynthesis